MAVALSVPAGFPGRDFMLVAAFCVILGTVLLQGTTLGALIRWALLSEPAREQSRMSMSQAEAAMAQAQDLRVAPHCSIGPVALCAALHFGWSTRQVMIQENFGDFDVPWRREFVNGWHPCRSGEYELPARPGLGIELNEAACREHPYRKHSFPSLWDRRWVEEFTQND